MAKSAAGPLDLLALDSGTGLVILSGLVSLVVIYTLVSFVKNRHASSSRAASAGLCQACKQSNLNCRIIYNRLLVSRGSLVGDGKQVCARCGLGLDSKATAMSVGGRSRGNGSYGKVEEECGGQAAPVATEETAAAGGGEPSGLWRGSSEARGDDGGWPGGCADGDMKQEETAAAKRRAVHEYDERIGTGTAFEPGGSSTTEVDDAQLRQQLSSLTSETLGSFQTVLELAESAGSSGGQLEPDAMTPEAGASSYSRSPQHIDDDECEKMAAVAEEEAEVEAHEHAAGGPKFKLINSVRKVLRSQRIIELMRHPLRRSSLSPFNGSSNADSRPAAESSSSSSSPVVTSEEPEFLSSKKLRSAEIQIQQHPIIFGKSKDSILVPEFMEQPMSLVRQAAGESEYPTTTTRVLTDEKGHSIKIRIASPPPQRQTQLAKLHQHQHHQRHQQQQQEQQQQRQRQLDQHRDSVASDSPLMWMSEGRRASGLSSAGDEPCPRSPEPVGVCGVGGGNGSSNRTSVKTAARSTAATATSRPMSMSREEPEEESQADDEEATVQQQQQQHHHQHHYNIRGSSNVSVNGNDSHRGSGKSRQAYNQEDYNDHQDGAARNSSTAGASAAFRSRWFASLGSYAENDKRKGTAEEVNEDVEDEEAEAEKANAFEAHRNELDDDGQPRSLLVELSAASLKGEQRRRYSQPVPMPASNEDNDYGRHHHQHQHRASPAPIEAFNDSNTSEFDDAGWDSRQDTSLDLSNGQQQQQHGQAPPTRNEAVMDADLRQANRLNMELLVLQSAAQNVMGSMVGRVPGGAQASSSSSPRSSLRSKSLAGSSAAGAFQQSGVLQAASEFNQHHPAAAALAPTISGCTGRQFATNSGDHHHAGEHSAQQQHSLAQYLANRHRARTSSDQDSGYAGGGTQEDSRKSSVSGGHFWPVSPFGQSPSVRLLIRPVAGGGSETTRDNGAATPEQPEQQTAATSRGRAILNTLASIGRSASRSSENESPASLSNDQQQLFEVHLLEAHNVGARSRNTSTAAAAAAAAATAATGGQFYETPTAGSRARNRRESLLGALVAAATSPQPRRASVDGVFVRVFKHQQQDGCGGDAQTWSSSGRRKEPTGQASSTGGQLNRASSSDEQQPATRAGVSSYAHQYDSLSLHSTISTGSPGADYIQLPLVKPTSSGSGGDGSLNFSQLALPSSYSFVCRESEFPLRISLYEVSKRGGARYTLGHCFVSLADWSSSVGSPMLAAAAAADTCSSASNWLPPSSSLLAAKRASSGSNSSSELGEQLARCKFVILPTPSQSPSLSASSPGEIQLEYRLYQTILEAIK